MLVKLLTEPHLEFLSLKEGCTGSSESTLVKCHIIGNHVAWLNTVLDTFPKKPKGAKPPFQSLQYVACSVFVPSRDLYCKENKLTLSLLFNYINYYFESSLAS